MSESGGRAAGGTAWDSLAPEPELDEARPSGPEVILRTSDEEFPILQSPCLEEFAAQWRYIVRNRRRWLADDEARQELGRRAQENLFEAGAKTGFGKAALEKLSEAGLVEVELPFVTEEQGEQARILPWEHVLSFAAKACHKDRKLLVVRRLKQAGRDKNQALLTNPIFAGSSPGKLADFASFESEEEAVFEGLGLQEGGYSTLLNPSAQGLREQVSTLSPGLIHLSGFDFREGARLLEQTPPSTSRDGCYLPDEYGDPVPCGAAELAQLLNAGAKRPRLVTMNLENSASRICPLTVAAGTGAAVGFLDSMDRSVAEYFYAVFYGALRPSSGAPVLEAFACAFDQLRRLPQVLREAGFVLWTTRSFSASQSGRKVADQVREGRPHTVRRIRAQKRDGAGLEAGDPPLRIYVTPRSEINYSLLHNNRNLFHKFELQPRGLGNAEDVEIEVSLQVGPDSFPFRATFTIDKASANVNDRIRLPLTWDYLRQISESVRTTLYVRVKQRGHVLHEQTYPIALRPMNEWKDNLTDGVWLPSFVLPRDPAVQQVLDRAQRHLRILADDPEAGFSGYQSIDHTIRNPYLGVDLQAQAIWSALKYEFQIAYINPPPAYAQFSQRIRSPTEVVTQRRGACLDLALLVAACLEYVDIYPAIVLLKGHAFPLYWRSLGFHNSFSVPEAPEAARGSQDGAALEADAEQYSWAGGPAAYEEVLARVERGELVAMEAVSLTDRRRFADALEDGLRNLARAEDFDAIVDIKRARVDPRVPVTPLPM